MRIYCDWFVVDATASAAWRAAHDAAEDARLAALPGAQRVEQVLRKRKTRRAGAAGEEYLVRWHGYDEAVAPLFFLEVPAGAFRIFPLCRKSM